MKRPQISLRALLWIITIAAFLVSWSIDRHQLEERCRRAETALFHAEAEAARAKAELGALEVAHATMEKNRRAAAGVAD